VVTDGVESRISNHNHRNKLGPLDNPLGGTRNPSLGSNPGEGFSLGLSPDPDNRYNKVKWLYLTNRLYVIYW